MLCIHNMNSSHGEDPTDTLLSINSCALCETKRTNKVHHYLVFRTKNKLTNLLYLGQLAFSILSQKVNHSNVRAC